MVAIVELSVPQQHPRRSGNRNDTTLQVEGPTPPRPCRFSGENKSWLGNMMIDSDAMSARWAYHAFLGQYGAMMVAAAPDCLSLAAKSSNSSHGGLQQLCYLL